MVDYKIHFQKISALTTPKTGAIFHVENFLPSLFRKLQKCILGPPVLHGFRFVQWLPSRRTFYCHDFKPSLANTAWVSLSALSTLSLLRQVQIYWAESEVSGVSEFTTFHHFCLEATNTGEFVSAKQDKWSFQHKKRRCMREQLFQASDLFASKVHHFVSIVQHFQTLVLLIHYKDLVRVHHLTNVSGWQQQMKKVRFWAFVDWTWHSKVNILVKNFSSFHGKNTIQIFGPKFFVSLHTTGLVPVLWAWFLYQSPIRTNYRYLCTKQTKLPQRQWTGRQSCVLSAVPWLALALRTRKVGASHPQVPLQCVSMVRSWTHQPFLRQCLGDCYFSSVFVLACTVVTLIQKPVHRVLFN